MQAFKRSLKRSNKEKVKKEDDDSKTGATGATVPSKELAALCQSPVTCSEAPPDYSERRGRRAGEDDVDYEASRSGAQFCKSNI